MYHYLGNFSLYQNYKFDNHSGLSCLCKINNKYFDCRLNINNHEKFASNQASNESIEVEIDFLSIDLVSPLIKLNSHYRVFIGLQPIGEISITADPWLELENLPSEGEIRSAIAIDIGWTTAEISLTGGITTYITSEDMGLKQWEEINQVLKKGQAIEVRIDKIDKFGRKIKVSLIS